MTAILKNFIGGEWVDGPDVARTSIRPTPATSSANSPRADKAQSREGDRGRQGRLPGLVALDAAGALRRR